MTSQRNLILTKVLAKMEEVVTLFDAIRDLSKIWNMNVKKQAIANCFRKARFIKDKLLQDIEY